MTVSEKIRQLRLSAHLSQSKVAQDSGYSLAYIKKIENGSADPTIGCLRSIVEACGKDLLEFFGSTIPNQYNDPVHKTLHEKLEFILDRAGRRAIGIAVNIEDLYEAALSESLKKDEALTRVAEDGPQLESRKRKAVG